MAGMKTELVVQGDKREVMEAIGAFLKGHESLYKSVSGPGRFTDYSVLTASLPDQNPERAAGMGCLALLSLPFVGAAADTLTPKDPRLRIRAKPVGDGETRLKLSTEGRASQESVDALLSWLREELDARPA